MDRNQTPVADFHARLTPAEVRQSDRVSARIRDSLKDSQYRPIRVWRLSPLGIELVRDQSSPIKGQQVDLVVVIDGNRSTFQGLVVDESVEADGFSLIFIRFLGGDDERKARDKDNRRAQRWLCSEEHYPQAIAAAPGKYGSFISFQIRNISKAGMLLFTSLDHAYLIPGMTLAMTISLPTVGAALIQSRIVRVRIGNDGVREILELGVENIDLTRKAKVLLGQYIVQFSEFEELDELIADGFIPNNVEHGLSFEYVKTAQEFRELLSFRAKIASDKGDISTHVHARDAKSRIVIGRLGGTPVIAARVGFPDTAGSLEAEELHQWPDDFGRRDQAIEVSGVVIGTSHFRTEFFASLMRFVCTSCISEERTLVVVNIGPRYRRFLQKIGWSEFGSVINTEVDSVFISDAIRAIQGRDTNPIWWNYVWGGVTKYLLEAGVLDPKGVDRWMISILRMFAPVTKIVFSWKHLRRTMKSSIKNNDSQ